MPWWLRPRIKTKNVMVLKSTLLCPHLTRYILDKAALDGSPHLLSCCVSHTWIETLLWVNSLTLKITTGLMRAFHSMLLFYMIVVVVWPQKILKVPDSNTRTRKNYITACMDWLNIVSTWSLKVAILVRLFLDHFNFFNKVHYFLNGSRWSGP